MLIVGVYCQHQAKLCTPKFTTRPELAGTNPARLARPPAV
jgi:hypothetical protein